jgi:hypothetical protein
MTVDPPIIRLCDSRRKIPYRKPASAPGEVRQFARLPILE